MDKSTFIERAPEYYALALAYSLREAATRTPQTIGDMLDHFANYASRLESPVLVEHGMKILVDAHVVEEITDDFGPSVYVARSNLADWMKYQNEYPVFKKFAAIQSESWLVQAIRSVNEQYHLLDIKSSDFSDVSRDQFWEPIPLDRSDPKLEEVARVIDQAIVSIEADNGYAVTFPGERDYALSALKTVSTLIRQESQIYWMQLKTFAIDPLNRVIKRFGEAAVGLVARAAKDALFDWLKDHIHKALDWL